jgi:hypothetical protein
MSDKRIGDLNFGWFILSTTLLLGLALLIFRPLSRNMVTVNEASESQKRIESLEKRVREVDELKGRVEAMEKRSTAPQTQPPPGATGGQGASSQQGSGDAKPKH